MKILAVCVLVCAMMPLLRADGSQSCPTDWRWIQGRCFRYVPTLMSWSNAEKNCLSMGGNLASVHSFQEYHEIQNMILEITHMQKLTWIGGYNVQQIVTWFWSDGSPFFYSNWCAAQPDNLSGNQYCIQMNFSDKKCWDDAPCYVGYPSVCVKKNS